MGATKRPTLVCVLAGKATVFPSGDLILSETFTPRATSGIARFSVAPTLRVKDELFEVRVRDFVAFVAGTA